VSVRTIALTLKPTADERVALERLQRQWGAACNYISQVAWERRDLKFNKVRLQRLLYQEVRERFGLLAQHVIRAIAVVADSYKADKTHQHTFRDDAAVVLDTPRLYRIAHNRASIATLDGRLNVQLGIGGHQRQQIASATKLAEADLIRDEKGRWRLLVSAHYADLPAPVPADVLGVDLGIRTIARDSDNNSYTGDKVLGLRARYAHMRTKLQKKGTASARKLRRKRAKREHRFQRDVNHCIAKDIVQRATQSGRAVALEDLTHLRERVRLKKSQRRVHSSWAYADLRAKIVYKAAMAGVVVVFVDPHYTSQTCSRCGHCERANRQSQVSFLCRRCGFAAHADWNAALNIRVQGRAAVNLPDIPRSGVLSGAGTSPQPLGMGR
jgi:IS605 OrfB family transposase